MGDKLTDCCKLVFSPLKLILNSVFPESGNSATMSRCLLLRAVVWDGRVEHGPYREANSFSASQKNSMSLIETECSFPPSQQPTISPRSLPRVPRLWNNNIILYLFTAIGLSPGGSDYFACKQNMKLVTTKFKSGGLHEKHAVATWNVGNHLSICL